MLYVVATPIGNLQDITMRALETLRTVDVILCEDTRVTKKLLNAYDIKTPVRAVHQHTADSQIADLVAQLESGQTMAMVTDAGTPLISDPGHALVGQARAKGITVVPIPGASAVIAALQASGVDTREFVFLGFIPHKKGRQTMLQGAMKESVELGRTIVMYESPHRLLKTLDALLPYTQHVTVARELTKQFEEFVTGDPATVLASFADRTAIKGECVVILHKPITG